MRPLLVTFLAAWLLPGWGVASSDTPLAEARGALEKWVETRQVLARTEADWRSDKELLEQTVVLLERELGRLNEQLEKAQTDTTQVDKDRAALEAEKAELTEATARLTEWLAKLEQRLRTLSRGFPPPLLTRLDSLLRLLPEDPAKTRLSGMERMRNLIGILNEVDKFNSAIMVESEVRKRASGEELQVKTLYVGLAQAYFVDKGGTWAGVGIPGPEGWQWKEQPELAGAIQRSLAIYEGRQPPAFVGLPFVLP